MNAWLTLPNFLLDGIFLGSYYGVLALGVALIFGVLEIGDVAQGGLFTLGSYLAYTLAGQLGLNYFIAPLLIVPVTAGLSTVFGVTVYRRLRKHGIAPTFLGAVSILLIIQSIVAMGYGERAKTLASPLSPGMVHFGSISIYSHKLLVIFSTAILGALVWYLVRKTRWGKGLRAVSQNREMASLSGVSPLKTTGLAFALAGGLAGLAGFLTAPVYTITPFAGRLTVLKAFVISRVALGSVPAVLGLAVLIGITESLTSAYFLGELSNLIPFGLLILVTIFRHGVMGPEEKHSIRLASGRSVRINFPWNLRGLWLLGGLVLLLPVLLDTPSYLLHLFTVIGTTAIAVSSLDLLYGYAGLPSLAQGAFFGVGAYASAVLTMSLSNSVLLALAVGAAVAGIIGVLVGSVGVRTGRHWTSFTFITTIIFTIGFTNLDFLTGGPSGLSGVPGLSLNIPFINKFTFNPFLNKKAYYLMVVAELFLVLLVKNLALKSWFGRSVKAIREDEGLARSVGIPSRRYKVLVFGLSAGIAGMGGSLFAHYTTYIHPDLFDFVKSFRFLMMNRIGGLGSLLGPILGSGFIRTVEEFTRPLNSYLAQVIFSGILIVTLIYFPGGLVGLLKKALARFLPERLVKTGEEKSIGKSSGSDTVEERR